jgi:GT2 family glycosyltransferase
MSTAIKATAVVIHYGSSDLTSEFCRSIEGRFMSTIVVANDFAPRPDDIPAETQWLIPERNLGFGGGVMSALALIETDVVAIFNTDLRIDQSCIDACLFEFTDRSVGIVGPTLTKNGSVQSAGGRLRRVSMFPVPGRTRLSSSASQCEWVTGAAMFVRRQVLETIGFDVGYFLVFEDVGLCLRASEAGWKVICVRAEAVHDQGEARSITKSISIYYVTRNFVWFAREHGHQMTRVISILSGALLVLRCLLGFLVLRKPITYTKAAALGLVDGIRIARLPGDVLDDEPLVAKVATVDLRAK